MADFPLILPFIFGLSKAEVTLPATAELSAAAGRGVSGSLTVGVGVSAGVALAAVGDANLDVSGDTSGIAGFGFRGTPTIEVTLTADSRLDALAGADLGVGAVNDVVPAYGLDCTLSSVAAGSADTRLDAVGDGQLAISVTPVGELTYNAQADFTVTADTNVVGSLGSDLTATLTGETLADGAVIRGQDIAASLDVTVEVDATPHLDRVADTVLPLTAGFGAETQYGQHLDTDLGVTAELLADSTADHPISGDLSVTVELSGLADQGSSFDTSTPVVVDAPAGVQLAAQDSTDVSATVGTPSGVRLQGVSESLLGAIAGRSATVGKTIHIGASLSVGVNLTAGASRGQKAQAVIAVVSDTSGAKRRGRFVAGNTHVAAHTDSEAVGSSEIAVRRPVTVALTAAMVSNQRFVAVPLTVSVVLAARAQLGGTPGDRIAVIDGEIRVIPVEPRIPPLQVTADNRLLPVGETDGTFMVPSDIRSMLVEQRI